MDESLEIGFVLYADEDTFDMYVRDNVHNTKVIDEDMNGAIMIEDEKDIEEIDFVFVKATFRTDMIDNITHDVSHHFPVDKTEWFDLVSQGIYDKIEAKKRQNQPKKPKKEKTTNVIGIDIIESKEE